MCNNDDLCKRVRRLEIAAIIFFAGAAVGTLLLFAHLVHDAHAFARLEQIVNEHHQK